MSMKRVLILRVTKVLILAALLGTVCAAGQTAEPATGAGAVVLYRELLNPSLDAKDVYQVREVSILLEDLHISISDGTMAFTREVNGHVAGAVYRVGGAGAAFSIRLSALFRRPDNRRAAGRISRPPGRCAGVRGALAGTGVAAGAWRRSAYPAGHDQRQGSGFALFASAHGRNHRRHCGRFL